MAKFTHLGFLLDEDCSQIDLQDCRVDWNKAILYPDYKSPIGLLDGTGKRTRTIWLTDLDENFPTKAEWVNFVNSLGHLHAIILLNNRCKVPNKHVVAYDRQTLRAFISRIRKAGMECFYAEE